MGRSAGVTRRSESIDLPGPRPSGKLPPANRGSTCGVRVTVHGLGSGSLVGRKTFYLRGNGTAENVSDPVILRFVAL